MVELFVQSIGCGLGIGTIVFVAIVAASLLMRNSASERRAQQHVDLHCRAVELQHQANNLIRGNYAAEREQADMLATIAANLAEEMPLRARLTEAVERLAEQATAVADESV